MDKIVRYEFWAQSTRGSFDSIGGGFLNVTEIKKERELNPHIFYFKYRGVVVFFLRRIASSIF